MQKKDGRLLHHCHTGRWRSSEAGPGGVEAFQWTCVFIAETWQLDETT